MRYITLETWASAHFEFPPSSATLRAWAKTGRFHPAAQKIAGRWMVQDTAEYCPAEFSCEALKDAVNRITNEKLRRQLRVA